MNRLESILQYIKNSNKQYTTAKDIGESFNISRSVASRYLNELVNDNKMIKKQGKPVIYEIITENLRKHSKQNISETDLSLEPILEEGMAAFLYTSTSLPILLIIVTDTRKQIIAINLS